MEKFVNGGIIYSIVVAVVLFAINIFININTFDYSFLGLPFAFKEGWGPCPPGMICRTENWENFGFDIIFIVIIGFAISYLKNKVKK